MKEISTFVKNLISNSDLSQIDYSSYGSCPKCSGPIIKGKKGFGCSKWKDGCNFVFWNNLFEKPLSDNQVRKLLQKKVLPELIQNEKRESFLLYLTKEGVVDPIPNPKSNRPKFKKPRARSRAPAKRS